VQETTAAPAGDPAFRQRILIVDDNVDAAESLGTMLAYSGHDVRVAHGGVEALSAAREFAPNVMILDLGMPEMDGYAVARAVRSDPRFASTRLIALSGYGHPDDRRRTADVGFDEHLVKPVEHDVLNAALG
jgi:two-component system CheB/CheR fusion protein